MVESLITNSKRFGEIKIRPIQIKDIEAVYILHKDEQVKKFAWVDGLENKLRNKKWILQQIEMYNNGYGLMALESNINGKFIGICGLRNREDLQNKIDLVYRILPDYRNQGIATSAIQEILKYGFDILNYHEIYCQIHKENAPSLHIANKFKFIQIQVDSPWKLFKLTYQSYLNAR